MRTGLTSTGSETIYHKWATADQLLACYPQFPEFLSAKKRYDPDEIFVSNWYNSLNPTFS